MSGFEPPQTFAAGTVLAERFEIRRLIAIGGMGEVYEALDLELTEPIALKTIRPSILGDERVVTRFRREIQAARRVTHPNVCRTFDVFHHEGEASSPEGRVTFLTMELLRGETLKEVLRREGPLSESASLELARQMVAALEAAHDAGVIHRDLKSPNVVLVSGARGRRVVITDFGLAREVSAGAEQATVTRIGEVVGSPSYMAPEQARGEEVGPEADIYGLGVVLYEAVTGRLPFEGHNPVQVLMARLGEEPPSPRHFAPDLDSRWEAVILRCIDRRPEARFHRAADVLAALEGRIDPAYEIPAEVRDQSTLVGMALPSRASGASTPRRVRSPAVAWALGLVLATVLLALGISWWWERSPPPPGEATVSSRQSLAVLHLKNLTGREEAAWLSTALAEMLATELAVGGEIRLVPDENVAGMFRELSLEKAESFGPETLSRIRGYLGTDLLLSGSYFATPPESRGASGDEMRLDLRIQDARRGETVAVVSERGPRSEILDLVAQAGGQLRAHLGIHLPKSELRPGLGASLPVGEGARLYAEGLDQLRRGAALKARDLLREASHVAPDSPRIWSALAQAWERLGYQREGLAAARRAFELSQALPQQERLKIEGEYRYFERSWAEAAEIFGALVRVFPDDPEYGLRLADAQALGEKTQEAFETLQRLRRLPAPTAENPGIALRESDVLARLGRYEESRQRAVEAEEKARSLGAESSAAKARLYQGRALARLGELETAGDVFRRVRQVFASKGERANEATALLFLGNVLFGQGRHAEAGEAFGESLEIYRQIGHRLKEVHILHNLAIAALDLGNLEAAEDQFRQTLKVSRELEHPVLTSAALAGLGHVAKSRGRWSEAQRLFEESLTMSRELGDPSTVANGLNNLAQIAHEMGDLASARRASEEALHLLRELGAKRDIGQSLLGLARVDLAAGQLDAARGRTEEALELHRGMGANLLVANCRLLRGEILLEQGEPEQAEAELRGVLGDELARSRALQVVQARLGIARSLHQQQRFEAARKLLGTIELPPGKSAELETYANLLTAQLDLAQERFDEARGRLDRMLEDEGALRNKGARLMARHLREQVDLADGRRETAIERLVALEREALELGFGLVAAQIRETLRDAGVDPETLLLAPTPRRG